MLHTVKFKINRGSIFIYYRKNMWSTGFTIKEGEKFSDSLLFQSTHRKDDNKTLRQIESEYNDLIQEAIQKGLNPVDFIKNKLTNKKLDKEATIVLAEESILEKYKEWCDWWCDKERLAQSTRQSYATSQINLEHYIKHCKGGKILHFTYDWLEGMQTYYFEKKNLSAIIVRRYVDYLKNFAHYLFKKYRYEVDKNIAHIKVVVKQIPKADTIVVLTKELLNLLHSEWQMMEKFFEENRHHLKTPFGGYTINDMKIAEYMLFLCQTGLRFSDFTRLQEKQILKKRGEEFIDMSTMKTKEKFYVPLNSTALYIFNKHHRSFVDCISNVNINFGIKNLLRKNPKFHMPTTYQDCEKGTYVMKTAPLCEVFSVHDCRATFITFLIKSGFSFNEVIEKTGHRDIKTLQSYFSIFSEKNTKAIEFF